MVPRDQEPSPLLSADPLLDELITVSETVKAKKLLSSGMAPGSHTIPAEIYKAESSPETEKLTELFQQSYFTLC